MLTAGLLLALVAQTTDSLTLSQALARARGERPRIAGVSAAIDRARGTARVFTLVPNPTSQYESDDVAPTNKFTTTQQLAWLPRRGADRATGQAGIARAIADSAQGLADVARDVRRAFFGALAADRQLGLATEQAALADSLAHFAARRAEAGDISDLERDQIALEASRARLLAAQSREAAMVARVDLARAVAWGGATPPRPSGSLDEALRVAGLPEVSSRAELTPAVRGAVADSTTAAERLRATRISRIPLPGLVVGNEWGGTTAGRNWILGFAVPFPLWSQGNEAVAQARGAAAEQAALTAETRLATRALVVASEVRVTESARRALFARDSLLPDARRVRAGAVRLYEEGRTSVVPVLDALRAERDIGRLAVLELLSFQTARADLDAALGRWP